VSLQADIPEPASERSAWIVAIALGALGALALALVLTGAIGRVSTSAGTVSPPPVPAVTPTPEVAASLSSGPGSKRTEAESRSGSSGLALAFPDSKTKARLILGDPSSKQAHRDLAAYQAQTSTHIASDWMQGFYPIYATAQRAFGVNWLLIASIHKQESAFSTAPSTYGGLNFAGCCGGPMQFNVTNGPVTTWALVSDSYRYGTRPADYDHMTGKHPSIYDDFDSIMAAAHLLSADGAGNLLDASAWNAAYDYYGHDATGVTYADQVLARAIGWSQHGFCINCGLETALVEAVSGAYGAPVAVTFATATVARKRTKPRRPAR
jgi:hypothetical protein